MSRLALSVMALISSLTSITCITPVAYAETTARSIKPDCAGAGDMGDDSNVGCRSTGLSKPDCVGAGCLGY
jgi:hypothetical protein